MSERTGLIVAIVAAFFFGCTAGALGGFVGASMVMREKGPRFHGAPPPGRLEARIRQDIEERLDLTPEQAVRFRAVLRGSRMRYAAVRESTRAQLDAVLTPEQRERYRTLESRYFVRRRGHGRGLGPPPHVPQPEQPEGDDR